MKNIILAISIFLIPLSANKLSLAYLDGKNGEGYINKTWSSDSLQGKAHLILYMNPNNKKSAMPFLNKLQAKNYPSSKFSTVAIVNLKATWLPNSVIISKLKDKSKDFKNTTFIFDKARYFSKVWNLPKDTSTYLVIDKNMRVLYKYSGKITSNIENKIFNTISKVTK